VPLIPDTESGDIWDLNDDRYCIDRDETVEDEAKVASQPQYLYPKLLLNSSYHSLIVAIRASLLRSRDIPIRLRLVSMLLVQKMTQAPGFFSVGSRLHPKNSLYNKAEGS